jgi:hypothetical protein
MVLQVLREHQLYANLIKCSFYDRHIHYLGHIISEEGIVVDHEKIKSIEGCKTPKNVSEVRSFMGFASYYRRFIEGFSNISHSITYLQKKCVRFEWTSDCERCFQCLKNLFTSAPILNIVDPSEDFIVWTYDCKEGLGEVLGQNDHVIFYDSKKLKDHEKHYATHDLELVAIVHALKYQQSIKKIHISNS